MEDRGTFALALDAHKRQVDALTSNPGHLLFCGVATPEQASRAARTLLSGEMFSGFGIRTMGAREGGFNPMSYHNGSVWPHDNAIALAGLVRYGLIDEAATLAIGFISALARFADNRPPELFCGFSRSTSISIEAASRQSASRGCPLESTSTSGRERTASHGALLPRPAIGYLSVRDSTGPKGEVHGTCNEMVCGLCAGVPSGRMCRPSKDRA
jgi:glycogen debranching enzyme